MYWFSVDTGNVPSYVGSAIPLTLRLSPFTSYGRYWSSVSVTTLPLRVALVTPAARFR